MEYIRTFEDFNEDHNLNGESLNESKKIIGGLLGFALTAWATLDYGADPMINLLPAAIFGLGVMELFGEKKPETRQSEETPAGGPPVARVPNVRPNPQGMRMAAGQRLNSELSKIPYNKEIFVRYFLDMELKPIFKYYSEKIKAEPARTDFYLTEMKDEVMAKIRTMPDEEARRDVLKILSKFSTDKLLSDPQFQKSVNIPGMPPRDNR